ncbi:MAG: hypothetical protein KDB50_11010 [Mycobacterium sp.]|nr:hypothetical protein [Mycobacterium sp.]
MWRAALVTLATGVASWSLLAGCSSNPGSENPAPTESSASSAPQLPPAAPAEHGGLAECLRGQGVTDAGGPAAVLGPPDGVDQATWDKAMQACSSLAPGPGAP